MTSPERMIINTKKYRKTKKGLITNLYHKLKQRNKVDFNLKFLHEFANCKKFDRLFKEWEESGYNKQFIPSLDRINNKIHYIENNIQWLTWAENRYKAIMERRSRKGPVLQMMGEKVIARYRSQKEATIKTGISQGNISQVLLGNRVTACGYRFIYEYKGKIKYEKSFKT